MTKLLYIVLVLILIIKAQGLKANTKPSKLMLAKTYQINQLPEAIEHYSVTEKLDGIRAIWTGKDLITKQGNVIRAPKGFTTGFPANVIEGELWISRGLFQQTLSVVMKDKPSEQEWNEVRFMAFDLPTSPLTYAERYKALKALISQSNNRSLDLIPQYPISSAVELAELLKKVTQSGGEGLMLNLSSGIYQAGRSNNLLKLKPYTDADAVVLQHFPGSGKLTGLLGSILVKNKQGKVFKIGSGFSVAERSTPPEIGSIISYKYSGFTRSGLPRFATFLRKRNDITSLH